MPLTTISGDQAFANLRANRKSLWPDGRKDQVRLSGDYESSEREIDVVLQRDPSSTRAQDTLKAVRNRRDARRDAEIAAQIAEAGQPTANFAGE